MIKFLLITLIVFILAGCNPSKDTQIQQAIEKNQNIGIGAKTYR